MDLNKLTVVKLRQELSQRGLDTKGTKAVLVQRLQEVMDKEDGNEPDKQIQADDSAGGDSAEVEEPQVEEPASEDAPSVEEEPKVQESPVKPEVAKADVSEATKTTEEPMDTSASAKEDAKPKADEKKASGDKRGEKRKRTPPRKRSPSPEVVIPEPEPEEPIDESLVVLSSYDSDLNLIMDKTRCSAKPRTEDGFCMVWAGARASYGFKAGKIWYEVKVDKELEVTHLPADEPSPHIIRAGWSSTDSGLQLGEEKFSYGYDGTGKASTNCQFRDFGTEFKQGDVVGCYINLDVDPVIISVSCNGVDHGVTFKVRRNELEDRVLFPHVLSKNCEFIVNFGQLESPFFPPPAAYKDYVLPQAIPLEQRIRGPIPPATKADCEMIMMVGLPSSGKTVWVNQTAARCPEKKYNVLGTACLLDKMKVMGLPRRRNYSGRWDVLLQTCTKCLNTLVLLAAHKCRNYILDQTNVYPSAQRRKVRPFAGFKRRAVVIVPPHDEYKKRCEKRESEEGKDVPDSALLEMKANFSLPELTQGFDSIEYVELEGEDAKRQVGNYNREGKSAAQGKRFKGNDGGRGDRGPRSRWGDRLPPPGRMGRDRDFGGIWERPERFARFGGGGGGDRFERGWGRERQMERDHGRNGYDRRAPPPPRRPPGGAWGYGDRADFGGRPRGGGGGGGGGGRARDYPPARYQQAAYQQQGDQYGGYGAGNSYGYNNYSSYQQSGKQGGYGQQQGGWGKSSQGKIGGYGQQAGYSQQSYPSGQQSQYGGASAGYGQQATQNYDYSQAYGQWGQQQQYYNDYYRQYYAQQAANSGAQM